MKLFSSDSNRCNVCNFSVSSPSRENFTLNVFVKLSIQAIGVLRYRLQFQSDT